MGESTTQEYRYLGWGSLVATLAAVYPSAGLGRGSGDSGPHPEDGSESCAWLMTAREEGRRLR